MSGATPPALAPAQATAALWALALAYFTMGTSSIAVVGLVSNNYPASHGCVRVTNQAMDMLWATNAMPILGWG